jgi:hypothetical protein
MMAGYVWSDSFTAPAIFRFVDTPESGLILKHQADFSSAESSVEN